MVQVTTTEVVEGACVVWLGTGHDGEAAADEGRGSVLRQEVPPGQRLSLAGTAAADRVTGEPRHFAGDVAHGLLRK